VILPDLSNELRHEFVKLVKRMAEEGRVAVRNERRHAIEGLKKLKGSAGVSEDDIKDAETEAQKLTDQYIKKIDDHVAHKEKEILTV
jgi:ribosome recycling factor